MRQQNRAHVVMYNEKDTFYKINSLSDEIAAYLKYEISLRKLIYAHARFIQRYYYPRALPIRDLSSGSLIRYVFQTSHAFGLTRQDIRRIVGGSSRALMDKYITSLSRDSPAKGAR